MVKILISRVSLLELLATDGIGTGISIILPVYNEQKRIKRSLDRLTCYFKGTGWDYQLIFVDDRSTDSTTSILTESSQKYENIKLVIPPIHLGKGGSILYAAMSHELRDKRYVAYMDCDLAADPSELERLLEHIADNDIVIGSRILRGNLGAISRPMYRSFFSHIYSKLFRSLFRIPIYDPQCGLKLFRTEVLSRVTKDITTMGFAFDTDLIVNAFSERLQIKEVPILWAHGKSSKLNLITEIRKMATDLFSIWYYHHLSWKENKPCYPQKRGSLFGRILFGLLSLSNDVKTRAASPKFNAPLNVNSASLKLLSNALSLSINSENT